MGNDQGIRSLEMKILVTGGSNGIGNGVAKALAEMDNQSHEVIILCRSKTHGEEAIKEIMTSTGNKKISMVLCDLTKMSDVRAVIETIHNQHDYIDGLFVNAGIGYAAERVETEDGMDCHFQVNYLSQFMLTLNLLDSLEKSETGGRVIFNVTESGEIFWDDMQMKKKWGYVRGIHQAMVAKRMFLVSLNDLFRKKKNSNLAFIGFQVPKTVWTNQVNIIPFFMKMMATVAKFFGGFISVEKVGEIISPLLTEKQQSSLKKSGKFIIWKHGEYLEKKEDDAVLDKAMRDRLWKISLDLCHDDKTTQISEKLVK